MWHNVKYKLWKWPSAWLVDAKHKYKLTFEYFASNMKDQMLWCNGIAYD